MKKKGHPLAARVKKMMHKDEEVGKLAAATPVLLGRASSTRLFMPPIRAGLIR
jgi:hypothetical protein